MSFISGFIKVAKEEKKSLAGQRAITAIPAAAFFGGGSYGLYHDISRIHNEHKALGAARKAVMYARLGGMGGGEYSRHKEIARHHAREFVKNKSRSRIGKGIALGGMVGMLALGRARHKEMMKRMAERKAMKQKSSPPAA